METPDDMVIQFARDNHCQILHVGVKGRSFLGRFICFSNLPEVHDLSEYYAAELRRMVERSSEPLIDRADID